ncbi:hypothetical protein [Oryzifoliimicrobium ureilyticus]|uniref:hypothetical protein n=1 Tax=Oryzifoliimicrobium ureilyticus TaxID=3113724 RepID=UPI003075F684
MSSNPAATHVEPAGFRESDATSDMKRDASLLLSTEFRSDVRTKSALLSSLAKRQQSSTRASLDPQPEGNAVDRRQGEGGR